MRKFNNKYEIDSLRNLRRNYSLAGKYFLTINTYKRIKAFGKVSNKKMLLSPIGKIVKSEIENIPSYHPRIILDEWIIMPDHIHLLIELTTKGTETVGTTATQKNQHHFDMKTYRKLRQKMIIPQIVGKLKMLTSKQINIFNKSPGQKNWQSDYHDIIIRHHKEYLNIKQYIIDNPKNWKQ